jgi:hypothetical protein
MLNIVKTAAFLSAAFLISACGGGVDSTTASTPAPPPEPTPAPTPEPTPVVYNKWCWSMQSDTLRGTFVTAQSVNGDGTAEAGAYTVTDMSVVQTAFPDIEVGSISNGIYAFGTQPDYQIIWSGSEVTGFWRQNGLFTNGFAITNGMNGSGAYITFGIDYQSAEPFYQSPVLIFSAPITPTISPVGSTGKCTGEI